MIRSTPAVSVLMTAYNRERFIGAAIDSVLAQTFADFELIVVDDGSSDGTVDVVRQYLDDPRIRLIENDRNLGDYPNRNHAASFARSAFMKFHDSDDVMYPHCLDVMTRYLAAEPSAAFALSGSRSWPGSAAPMLLTPRLAYLREYVGHGLFHLGPACALFRTDAFRDLGGFPVEGVHSDLLFWLRACRAVNVLLVPGDLFWYREHAGQELRRGGGLAFARLEKPRWDALAGDDCPLSGDERELARRNQAAGIVKRIVQDVANGDLSLASFRARNAGLSLSDWVRYARRPQRRADAGSPPMPARAEAPRAHIGPAA